MNLHKILANAVVLAGFVAVPFIPFIVLGQTTFFPYIVGKNFAFRVAVEIMFSAWIVLAYLDPAYRPKKTWLVGAFTAFLFIITTAAIFGENPTKSFWSNFERMEGVVTYLHLFAYFIISSTVLTARDLWRPYLNLHLGAGVIMALYALVQLSGAQEGFRVDGRLGNSSYLGIYAYFNIFIAFFFIARETWASSTGKGRMMVYGAIALLQIVVLYHTGTRGAVLGLMVGLGLATLLIALFEKEKRMLRFFAIGVLVTLAVIVGAFIVGRDSTFVKETPLLARFSEISISNFSKNARVMVWGMAYEGFKERPVLGWGMENFNYVFNKYYDPKMYAQEQWFDRAHNVFFDWLIAGGILGLLGYLSLFGCAVYCIWRRGDSLSIVEKSVLTGLLGGYFFQNLFVFGNLTSLIYFATILAYVEGVGRRNTENDTSHSEHRKVTKNGEDITFMISGGALILALMLIYTVNYKGYKQNTTLIRAMSERSEKGAVHNLNLMKETLAYNSFGTAEAREQLASFSTTAFDQTKGISDIQKEFINLAKDELIKQAEERSRDARYQLFAGSFISRIGMADVGLMYLERALALSPTKHTILFELGNAYYNKKDFVKSEEMFRRAFELSPEFVDAEKYYLQILMVNRKRTEAEKVLKAYPIPGATL